MPGIVRASGLNDDGSEKDYILSGPTGGEIGGSFNKFVCCRLEELDGTKMRMLLDAWDGNNTFTVTLEKLSSN